jgi:hypothetical protein
MPATGNSLARRYRRLLWCYPPEYRRARGDEIVDTLLDGAAGRTRPRVREVANLTAHGMRCRLGRPASRSVVVWAALTALICGLFSASLGTWAAWHTARPLPEPDEAAATFREILPEHTFGEINRAPGLFAVSEQFHSEALNPGNIWKLPFGFWEFDEGASYHRRSVGTVLNGDPPIPQERTLALTVQRLRVAGWDVEPVLVSKDYGGYQPLGNGESILGDFSSDVSVLARRGDTTLHIELTVYSGPPDYGGPPGAEPMENTTTYLVVELQRAAPVAVYPAAVLSGLIGAVIGWIIFGWASRNAERRRASVKAAYILTMVLWWLPVLLVAPLAIVRLRYHSHQQPWPIWEWLGQPTLSLLFLAGGTTALTALAMAALPRQVHDIATEAPDIDTA